MIRHLIAFICMSATLAMFLVPCGAFADEESELNSLIETDKKELEQIKERLEKQEKSLSTVGAKTQSVLKTLRGLDDQLKLRERELKIYQWNMEANRKKIVALKAKAAEGRENLSNLNRAVSKRVRAIYKEGGLFPLKLMFSASNFSDLIRQRTYLESIGKYDSELFKEYKDQLQSIRAEETAVERARAKLIRLEKNALEKQEEIKTRKNSKSDFLKKLKAEKNLYLQARKELLSSSDRLNTLIAGMQLKLSLGKGLDISDKKGRLALPVKGEILNKFGTFRQKKFGALIVYNGINIRAQKGEPVRAISAGKVLFADFLEGYGNLVILGHGEKHHSLYGHLDEIVTQVGRSVQSRQIIGKAGDTGSLDGVSLYLEIRRDGKPVEPTQWFQLAQK